MVFEELSNDIVYVIDAHKNHSRTANGATRRWDGTTPYGVHPILCATLLLQETSLPLEIREKGYRTLLYHDVLEDTTVGLPANLPKEKLHILVSSLESKIKIYLHGQAIMDYEGNPRSIEVSDVWRDEDLFG